ncbi:MAG: patatin-like phospholipase family protein [Actinobacteria bacterium]|nr:patatin-like phospholipase family protein [Actinomycetota bacterium]
MLEALRARRSRQDRPGDRGDPHRIGLTIQGGGMRGVVSAAMLTALDDLGLAHAFDAIYGSSSGAMNGAYFLTGEGWRRLRIYWDYLTTPRFIDLKRYFRGNILDLGYTFETVLAQLEPLDYDAVLYSDVPLRIAITLVDELRTITVSDFTSKEDLNDALRASAWLPIAIRGTTLFRGQRAIDGTILTTHPHRFALEDGCTHVLSLSTRPLGRLSSVLALRRLIMNWELGRLGPGLSRAHTRAGEEYRKDRTALATWSSSPSEPPYVVDIAPLPWMSEIKPFEMDVGRLIVAARQAYDLMTCAVEGEDPAGLQTGGVRTIFRLTPYKGSGNQ